MRSIITRAGAGLTVVTLLAGAGVALASSGAAAKAHHQVVAGVAKSAGAGQATQASGEPTVPDTDNIQSGDQTTPDTAATSESTAPDTDNIQSGDQTTPDPAAASQAGSDQGQEATSDSGSEVAGNDGPGGHADEPANANADHQFQGQE